MHRIVALWGVPRSTSTAFMRMMCNRGDMTCFHEPFGEAFYYGEHPLYPGFRHGDETRPGFTIESVFDNIQQQASRGPVFLKDFPCYINHMWTPEFLSHFTHSFLIRDPEKTITSYFDKDPDVLECELGFAEQRALFDLLTALNHGTPPPVIDSDDLLDDPEGFFLV